MTTAALHYGRVLRLRGAAAHLGRKISFPVFPELTTEYVQRRLESCDLNVQVLAIIPGTRSVAVLLTKRNPHFGIAPTFDVFRQRPADHSATL